MANRQTRTNISSESVHSMQIYQDRTNCKFKCGFNELFLELNKESTQIDRFRKVNKSNIELDLKYLKIFRGKYRA